MGKVVLTWTMWVEEIRRRLGTLVVGHAFGGERVLFIQGKRESAAKFVPM
jgi:hypothetical protein